MLNKKSLFLIIFGVAVLMAGFWLVQTPKAKATDYKFIEVNLDTFSFGCVPCGLGNCTWNNQFHGINSFPHNNEGLGETILNLPDPPSAPLAGYDCGIFVIDWTALAPDQSAILYAKKSKKITTAGNISANLGARGTDWDFCCSKNAVAGTCVINGTDIGCDMVRDDNDGADRIAGWNYGNLDCTTARDKSLSVGVLTYRPLYDILCADTNTWKTCESNSCAVIGTDNWACNGGTGVWTKCAATETCDALTGACAVSNVLFLTASANPSAIGVNGTSTITFTVTKNAVPVNGATVEDITVTGGFISATSCTTGASGECTVTYTAPAIAGLYGVNAAKATKAGETDSGPAGVVITVLSPPIAPCGPQIGVLCNPVNNASDFYDVIVIAIRYILSLIALITLLFIVISGIKYLTSFGNEEKMRSAKDGLTSAIFGLALALMAYAILEVIIKILSS
ncbi:MAG: hypothetical protein Q8O46_00660 [bacterium]|nr:hypothetical protein [bacterium]